MRSHGNRMRLSQESHETLLDILHRAVGFYFDEIGGTPYKWTPSTSKVGTSYVLFIMAIFFTIIGELFACRVCAPMF